ncbi:hypothetical protein CGRA01v4_04960 [Colletotrichum graminicola]|nr:hypothetical protein CGRA01v4_04960 [Colletotrichum graminicola]
MALGRIRVLVVVCPPHRVQVVHGSAQPGPSHNTTFHMVSSSSQVPGEILRVCHLVSSRRVVWMVTSRRHSSHRPFVFMNKYSATPQTGHCKVLQGAEQTE